MVGLISEVSVEEFLSLGALGAILWRFEGHKNRVNFTKYFRIVVLKDPPILRFVIREKNAQAPCLLARPFFLSPNSILVACVLDTPVVQIVGIEKERLPFRKEHPSEGRAGLAVHHRGRG